MPTMIDFNLAKKVERKSLTQLNKMIDKNLNTIMTAIQNGDGEDSYIIELKKEASELAKIVQRRTQ